MKNKTYTHNEVVSIVQSVTAEILKKLEGKRELAAPKVAPKEKAFETVGTHIPERAELDACPKCGGEMSPSRYFNRETQTWTYCVPCWQEKKDSQGE